MSEPKTLLKTGRSRVNRRTYERMFRLARRVWQRAEEPDPEAAKVNDVVRGVGPRAGRRAEA